MNCNSALVLCLGVEVSVLEAAGLEVLINGMRQRGTSDDDLFVETEKFFDAFYRAFSGNDT